MSNTGTNKTGMSTLGEVGDTKIEQFEDFINKKVQLLDKNTLINQEKSKVDIEDVVSVLKGESKQGIQIGYPIVEEKMIKPKKWDPQIINKLQFLSGTYMNIMNKTGVSKLMKRIHEVVKIEELRSIEEDFSNRNFQIDEVSEENLDGLVFRDKEEKQTEEIQKDVFGNQLQVQYDHEIAKKGKDNNTEARNQSLGSYASTLITNQLIIGNVKRKGIEMARHLLHYLVLGSFLLTLIFSIVMRLSIDDQFVKYYRKIDFISNMDKISTPTSFLHKETAKLDLFQNQRIVDPNSSLGRPLMKIELLKAEKQHIVQNNLWLADSELKLFNDQNYKFYKRHNTAKAQLIDEISDVSFFTMYYNAQHDYSNIIELYDEALPTKFKPSSSIEISTSKRNLVEFSYLNLISLKPDFSVYNDLKSFIGIEYIIFMVVNLALTILGATIIYMMNNRMTKDIGLMAHLFLKIEKQGIINYLSKYEKILVSITGKSNDKGKDDAEEENQLKSKQKQSNKKLKKAENQIKNDNYDGLDKQNQLEAPKIEIQAIPESSMEQEDVSNVIDNVNKQKNGIMKPAGIQQKKGGKDQVVKNYSKSMMKKLNSDNQALRRKNFSTFTTKMKSDKVILYFVIFSWLVMVNIPLLIDFLLMSNLLSKVKKFNDAVITTSLLSSQILCMYAVFYTEALNKFTSQPLSKIELDYKSEINGYVGQLNELQILVGDNTELKTVIDLNICEYLKLDKDKAKEFEQISNDCPEILKGSQNFNLFISLNNLMTYKTAVMNSLENQLSTSQDVLKTDEFFYNDYLVYYTSKTMSRLNSECLDLVKDSISQRFLFRNIYLILFVVVSGINYFMYKRLLIVVKNKLRKNLETCYLCIALPIMVNNSYLVNFFSLKRNTALI